MFDLKSMPTRIAIDQLRIFRENGSLGSTLGAGHVNEVVSRHCRNALVGNSIITLTGDGVEFGPSRFYCYFLGTPEVAAAGSVGALILVVYSVVWGELWMRSVERRNVRAGWRSAIAGYHYTRKGFNIEERELPHRRYNY
jgi:hypothetical protein